MLDGRDVNLDFMFACVLAAFFFHEYTPTDKKPSIYKPLSWVKSVNSLDCPQTEDRLCVGPVREAALELRQGQRKQEQPDKLYSSRGGSRAWASASLATPPRADPHRQTRQSGAESRPG